MQNNLEWKLDDGYTKLREQRAQEISLTEEFVSNAALIASHGIKDKCSKKYRKMLQTFSHAYRKIAILSHASYGVLEGFIILAITVAMAYEGYKIFKGTATIGILVAFIQYSDFLIEPGKLVASLRVQGNKLMPSLKRVESIYNTEDINWGKEKPEFENYDIEFHNVSFSYQMGKPIFDRVES